MHMKSTAERNLKDIEALRQIHNSKYVNIKRHKDKTLMQSELNNIMMHFYDL